MNFRVAEAEETKSYTGQDSFLHCRLQQYLIKRPMSELFSDTKLKLQ